MPPENFKCKQCGHCCLNLSDAFQTSVSQKDVDMWRAKGRFDILEWVCPIPIGEGHYAYDIWISPKTGEDVWRCPWLRKLPKQDKYICRIHDVKPEHCRQYPRSKEHAEKTGCKVFK
jgi:Fe-S-cluster containining protein